MDDGERDLAGLKFALARAPISTDGKAAQNVATAVIAAFGGDRVTRDKLLEQALASSTGDARRMHLLGRLEERLGRAQAREHIEAASQADPKLMPARLALAPIALDQNERDDALSRVDAVLADHKEHLRAQLLRLFITANDADPKQLEASLNGLGDAMKLAGSVDEVLLALTRARLLRRQGKLDDAAAAIERAGGIGVDEPRLLAWVAREALAVGKLALAQRAASHALSAAPDVAPYRRLLARVLIERGDGERRARAARQARRGRRRSADHEGAGRAARGRSSGAAQAALAALERRVRTSPSGGRSSVRCRCGSSRSRRRASRSSIKRQGARAKRAGRSRSAARARRSRARRARSGAASERARSSASLSCRTTRTRTSCSAARGAWRRDADGRRSQLAQGARAFAGTADALSALGGCCSTAASTRRPTACQDSRAAAVQRARGRLGRVEALLGARSRSDDAQVQLDAIPEGQRDDARLCAAAAARVALARNKPGEALGAAASAHAAHAEEASRSGALRRCAARRRAGQAGRRRVRSGARARHRAARGIARPRRGSPARRAPGRRARVARAAKAAPQTRLRPPGVRAPPVVRSATRT